MKAIRWAGRERDHYFGPFTFTKSDRYKSVGIMLGSGRGDDDEDQGCRLRVELRWFTLHVALPPIVKPWRRWHEITSEPMRSKIIAEGRKPGYWDSHSREYGFTAAEGALHWHYGPQTHNSETTKSRCWFYPWRASRLVRHSLYDTDGKLFAHLPQKPSYRDWQHRWVVEQAITDACPTKRFEFADYDGEQIVATCRIEEREWARGKGIFRLFHLWRNRTFRTFDVRFSSEVGKRKGSWKGGTVGHSGDIVSGEMLESAFRRYCEREGLTFIGEVAL